jgi:hypothetical protein
MMISSLASHAGDGASDECLARGSFCSCWIGLRATAVFYQRAVTAGRRAD